jgi:hypothetical protein
MWKHGILIDDFVTSKVETSKPETKAANFAVFIALGPIQICKRLWNWPRIASDMPVATMVQITIQPAGPPGNKITRAPDLPYVATFPDPARTTIGDVKKLLSTKYPKVPSNPSDGVKFRHQLTSPHLVFNRTATNHYPSTRRA